MSLTKEEKKKTKRQLKYGFLSMDMEVKAHPELERYYEDFLANRQRSTQMHVLSMVLLLIAFGFVLLEFYGTALFVGITSATCFTGSAQAATNARFSLRDFWDKVEQIKMEETFENESNKER